MRQLLSDFTNPAQGAVGGRLIFPGLAVETSGKILVASGPSDLLPRNLLFRIHPKTGQRTVLSDFDDPTQGTIETDLSGVAVENSRQILVCAHDPNTYAARLFRVNQATGQHTVLSDSDNPAQGPSFLAPTYIAVVPKDSDVKGHEDSNAESRD